MPKRNIPVREAKGCYQLKREQFNQRNETFELFYALPIRSQTELRTGFGSSPSEAT